MLISTKEYGETSNTAYSIHMSSIGIRECMVFSIYYHTFNNFTNTYINVSKNLYMNYFSFPNKSIYMTLDSTSNIFKFFISILKSMIQKYRI